jgi:hypothetical protein
MAIDTVVLNPFNNVVASGVANVDLSNLFGYSIERIFLQLGGTFTKAMITGWQIKANGKIILDSDGSKQDSRMSYRGVTTEATFLTIDFLELTARSDLGLQGGALDTTMGVKNLRLEVTISGATAPTLVGWAEVARPQIDPQFQSLRPLIARVHRTTQTIGAAGTFPLQVPHLDPLAGGSIFKRINIFSASMTAAKVYRNGVVEHDSIKALNDRRQKDYKKVPQASLYMLDFIADDLQGQRVLDTRPGAGCQTAQVMGTFSASETITIEIEELAPLDVY